MARALRGLLLVSLLAGAVGCPPPGHPPTDTTCPLIVTDEDFRTSLFKLYEYALAPAGMTPLTATDLNTAAVTVRCGLTEHEEYWRRIALARLAARSTTDAVVLHAEHLLMAPDVNELVPTLQLKLAGTTNRALRFAIAYGVVVPPTSTAQPGMPTCQSLPPQTDAHATGWLATGSTTVLLGTSVAQVASTMDPQTWSLGCAKLVFPDTHIALRTGGGSFSIDPVTCTANSGLGHTFGGTWTGDLYEHFVPLTYASSFMKNILTIDASITPASAPVGVYHVHYGLNKSIQGQVKGLPPLSCGIPALYEDDGDITGSDTGSGWVSVMASKNVSFTENFLPNDPPPALASDAATGLHVLLDALPLMVCCPTYP